MTVYENIKTWLEKSLRNEFTFRNDPPKTIRQEYTAVCNILSDALESKPMTREHYLDWVAAWKDTYSKLSFESRQAKKFRKTSVVDDTIAAENTYITRFLRERAGYLLDLRARSKELAANSYQIVQAAIAA